MRACWPSPARPAGVTAGKVIEGVSEPVAASGHAVPDAGSELGQTLARMRRVDEGFDPHGFLAGAEAAFRMIVTAFAAGDRATLQPLLTADTYAGFDAAIAAREAAGETQTSEIRGVSEVAIEGAALDGTVAEVTVRFVSDQIAQTLGRDGKYVAGVDAVVELRDVWTFVRDLARSDPAWRLSQARSA